MKSLIRCIFVLLLLIFITGESQAVTPNAINVIKKYEGLRLKAYKCPRGKWTIGYGHTKGVKPGQVITEKHATKLLMQDIAIFEKGVKRILKRKYTAGQLDSFVSLCYNMGIYGCQKTKMIKLFNRGKIKQAGKYFTKYSYAGRKFLRGLKKRRLDERNLYYGL